MRASLGVLALVLTAGLAPLLAGALPTPGIACDASFATSGRYFPEALHTNDFISYTEALCGLQRLEAQFPTWVRREVVGQSVGWPTLTGGHDTFDVFVVRVTNAESAIPHDQKIRVVFQLSIHGNEKGGREGGLRVIEDFARDLGMSREWPELRPLLDHMELLFIFPNPDGWTHEEVQYRHNDACYFSVTCGVLPVPGAAPGKPGAESQNFVRVNGNGQDINRDWPTVGWQRESHDAQSEPESVALVAFLRNESNIKYASDIHGMLNPADSTGADTCAVNKVFGALRPSASLLDPTCFQNAVDGAYGHYVLTMLPAGRQDTREMEGNTALAELIKERLNADPALAAWNSAPSTGVWGGELNDWGTVWDTIGYTDSGFTSDWYGQDTGLNALGVDFELAYNHVTFDNYYPGVAQVQNDLHVRTVRQIVRAFMEKANEDLAVRLDTAGHRVAFLANPTVVTNAPSPVAVGWSAENPLDDPIDLAGRVFRAAPEDYFLDLQRHLGALDEGTLDRLTPADLARLGEYDTLIVAGSAYATLDAAAKTTIADWTRAGGNLVVTDEALQLLTDTGAVPSGAVDRHLAYAGAVNFLDRQHEFVGNVRGLARMTFEPVPLGFKVPLLQSSATAADEVSAPIWFVDADAFTGEAIGVSTTALGGRPDPTKVNYGRVGLGEGRISFLGALLPDPVYGEDTYYGVDSYATTYTGNQLLYNMVGWQNEATATPVVPGLLGLLDGLTPNGTPDGARVPGPAPVLAVLVVGALALVLRRRP